jgi:peptidoglycan hydrolase CwlO-like protein
MIITLIIVGGITLISVIAVVGDYITKVKTSKPSIEVKEINELKNRIDELEKLVGEQDKKIDHLETDISFANKLLEDKTK